MTDAGRWGRRTPCRRPPHAGHGSGIRRAFLAAIVLASSVHADDTPLARGELVIADHGGRAIAGRLHRLPPGGTPRVIETDMPLALPTAVAIDRDGTLVVAETRLDEPGRVVRVDPTTGSVSVLADGWPLISPTGLAIDDGGDVLIADLDAGSRLDFARGSLAGTGAIYRFSRARGVPVLVSHDCCPWNASGVAVLPSGRLVVVDMGFAVFTGDGALAFVDPTTGIQRVRATSLPLLDPWGVAVGPAGTLFVTETTNPQLGNAAILAIEPARGTVSVLSTGHPIADPRGLALTPDGDLVVADSASAAVYRIALPDRSFEVLMAGDPLVQPYGVAVAW